MAVYWPGLRIGVRRGWRRSRLAVAERPLVGERLPLGIRRPALEKFTVSGAGPSVGLADAAATGGWLPEM